MDTVLVSQKFQVVIPRSIRDALGIEPGQRLQAFRYGDRVELMPVRSLAQARGFLAALDSHVEREGDRV
ncbi:MAG: AbrB/MazE/SpoVT family DNA-binding domain-containing protein [Ideonella sp.]|nr:AbrB/MazE/SpoVT family DNA-binding domain-containing protein [Ideonella sp.]